MKKSLLAVAIAATLTLAACGSEEAKAEGVTVYGSAEQAITSQGGVADMAAGDNYIGFRAAESFGEGKGSAFAKIELGVDPERVMDEFDRQNESAELSRVKELAGLK